MQFSFQGLETFGAAIAAEVLGKAGLAEAVRRRDRDRCRSTTPGRRAPCRFISYWQVYAGRFPASAVRGKTVIIGATASILQDVHATPTSGSGPNGDLMAGPEIVANEAATVLHGIPLRDGAGWVNVLLIIAARLRRAAARPARLGAAGAGRRPAGGRSCIAIAAQLTFNSGWIIAVIDPEFALLRRHRRHARRRLSRRGVRAPVRALDVRALRAPRRRR